MDTLPHILSSLGLFLDFVSVLLLWRFALPQIDTGDGVTLILDDKNALIYRRWSSFGLALAAIGFLVQLASNFF